MAPFDDDDYEDQRPEKVPVWWWKKYVAMAKRICAALAKLGISQDDYRMLIPEEVVQLGTRIVMHDRRHITVELLVVCCELVESETFEWSLGIGMDRPAGAKPIPILLTYNGYFLQVLMQDWVRDLIDEAMTRMGKGVPAQRPKVAE